MGSVIDKEIFVVPRAMCLFIIHAISKSYKSVV
jgi:hypothetical protein